MSTSSRARGTVPPPEPAPLEPGHRNRRCPGNQRADVVRIPRPTGGRAAADRLPG